jgi:hypothetical protein
LDLADKKINLTKNYNHIVLRIIEKDLEADPAVYKTVQDEFLVQLKEEVAEKIQRVSKITVDYENKENNKNRENIQVEVYNPTFRKFNNGTDYEFRNQNSFYSKKQPNPKIPTPHPYPGDKKTKSLNRF